MSIVAMSSVSVVNINDGAPGAPGAKGDPGVAGAKIVQQKEQFYLSNSYSSLSGGSWSYTEPESVPDGKYLWGRVANIMSDGTTVYSDAVYRSVIGGLIDVTDNLEQSITNKIWQTDINSSINSYDNQTISNIRSDVSNHTQTLGQMTNTISTMNNELSQKADGTTVTQLANTVAQNEQTASSFRQTVQEEYIRTVDVDAKIAGIEIGGANLAYNTENLMASDWVLQEATVLNNTVTLSPTSVSSWAKYKAVNVPYKTFKDNTYTLSFYARRQSNSVYYQDGSLNIIIGVNASSGTDPNHHYEDPEIAGADYSSGVLNVIIGVNTESGIYNSNFDPTTDKYKIKVISADDLTSEWKRYTFTVEVSDDLDVGVDTAFADTSIITFQFSSDNATDEYTEDKTPYLLRKTGGGADVGTRENNTVVGGTVAWNQLFNIPGSNISKTENGVTITDNRDGSFTVSTETTGATSRCFISMRLNKDVIANHKYCFICCPTGGSDTSFYSYLTTLTGHKDFGNGTIYSCVADGAAIVVPVYVVSGAIISTPIVFKPQLFDLTQMFGSTIADYIYSLEQSTAGAGVAWFKKLFPASYYPYNAGELMSVSGLQSHDMVGFNLWTNDNYELDNNSAITKNPDNSLTITNQSYQELKNRFPIVETDSQIYCQFDVTTLTIDDDRASFYFYIVYTDGTKNLKRINLVAVNNKQQISLSSTAGKKVNYVCFGGWGYYGSVKIENICINFSDSLRNGTYEPYTKNSYPLDNTLTLRGIPKLDANNNLYYDGDTYESDGTVTRKYGVVDLGTLTWKTWTISGSNVRHFYTSPAPLIPAKATGIHSPMICTKYVMSTGGYTAEQFLDKTMLGNPSYQEIRIRDDSFNGDPDAFKTAMSGVMLVYELATPTTATATSYQNPQICDPSGTEAYITTSIVPVGHETQYFANPIEIRDIMFEQATHASSWEPASMDVSTKISSVEQTADGVIARVEAIESDYTTSSDLSTAISQSATNITSTVAATYAQKTDAIINTSIEYASGTSTSVPPMDGWSTSAPQWEANRYIWQRTAITKWYNDPAPGEYRVTYSEPTCIQGAKGTNADGIGIQSISVTYGISNSPSVQPTTWSNTIPVAGDGEYLWTKKITDYVDPSVTDTIEFTYAKQGINGHDGTSATITSIKYQEGTSPTTPPTGTWGDSPVSVASTHYLWTKTTYNDGGTEKVSYGVAYQGFNGAPGIGIDHITEYYQVSSSSSTAPTSWQETVPAMNATDKFLWNYEVVTYTDGSTEPTNKRVIGVFGRDGSNGTNGVNTATVYLYQRAASAPAKPSTTLTYDFSQKTLSGTLGNWQQTIPSGGNPCYVTIATASSSTGTDTIDASEWMNPIILVKDGTNGTNGVDGYNTAVIYLYQRAASTPAKPSPTFTYTFSDGSLSGTLGNWQRSIPGTNGNPCYVISASVFSRSSSASVTSNSWTDPVILAEDGTDGTDGRSITGVTNKYLASSLASGVTKSTTGWTDAVQSVTSTNKYLWNYEIISYSSGSNTETDPCIIGVYGEKGEQGVGITSVIPRYCLWPYDESSNNPPTNNYSHVQYGWFEDRKPDWVDGMYLWTQSKIVYSDGETRYTAAVCENILNEIEEWKAEASQRITSNAIISTVRQYGTQNIMSVDDVIINNSDSSKEIDGYSIIGTASANNGNVEFILPYQLFELSNSNDSQEVRDKKTYFVSLTYQKIEGTMGDVLLNSGSNNGNSSPYNVSSYVINGTEYVSTVNSVKTLTNDLVDHNILVVFRRTNQNTNFTLRFRPGSSPTVPLKIKFSNIMVGRGSSPQDWVINSKDSESYTRQSANSIVSMFEADGEYGQMLQSLNEFAVSFGSFQVGGRNLIVGTNKPNVDEEIPHLKDQASPTAVAGKVSNAIHGFRVQNCDETGAYSRKTYIEFGDIVGKCFILDSGKLGVDRLEFDPTIGLVGSATYTLSFTALWKQLSNDSSSTKQYMRAILKTNEGIVKTEDFGTITQADKGVVTSGLCRFTFEVPIGITACSLIIQCSDEDASHYSPSDYLEITDLMLEQATIPSNWSPAPEEINDRFESMEFKITPDAISATIRDKGFIDGEEVQTKILANASTIRLQTGTLQWIAQNSQLDESGHLIINSAEIGGIYVTGSAIYSAGHTEYNSAQSGFYLDKYGKFGVGNNNAYFRWSGNSLAIKTSVLEWSATNSSMTADGYLTINGASIGNFTISGGKLYSNGHSAYNTQVPGIYIGNDAISFGSGAVTYFNSNGTGKIGSWIVTTSSFYSGEHSAYNSNVSGVYIGTEGIALGPQVTYFKNDGTGKIGPWLVTATSIYKGSGWAGTSEGDMYFGSDGLNIAGKFKVTKAGVLTATGATISGSITATGGKIGPWSITETSIQKGSGYNNSASGSMYFGNSGLSITDKFVVSNAGVLSATGATISGNITATGGKIGPWSITDASIQKSGGYNTAGSMYFGNSGLSIGQNFVVTSAGALTAKSGTIGGWTITSAQLCNSTTLGTGIHLIPGGETSSTSIGGSSGSKTWAITASNSFGVTTSGILYATQAHVSGTITASSGSIGPWIINSTSIYKGNGQNGGNEGDMYFGSEGLNIAGDFTVSKNGHLYANDADINGEINAWGGSIGGWNISSDSIYKGSGYDNSTSGSMYFGDRGLSVLDRLVIDSTGTLISKGPSEGRPSKLTIKDAVIKGFEIRNNGTHDVETGRIDLQADYDPVAGDYKGHVVIYASYEIHLQAFNGISMENELRLADTPTRTGTTLVLDKDGIVCLQSSSKRYKNYLGKENDEDALKLLDLPVIKFNYKDDETKREIVGLFAEDVAEAYSDGVNYNKDGLIESYDQNQLLCRLLRLVQIQHKELESLKQQLNKTKK